MPLDQFVTHNWQLFAALAVILALLANNLLGERLRGYTSIDPAGAVGMINHQNGLILDVRSESELRDGVVVNSRHIPLATLKQRLPELEKFKDVPIICACRSGHRSATACAQLRKQGFEKVYNLRGGMMAWRNANLPVIRAG